MIRVDIPEVFMYFNSPKRFKGAFGGRGSAKSWSVAGLLTILGTRSPLKILCGREFQTSINDSVKALLDDQIARYKLEGFYRSLKKEIQGANGTLIKFCGLKHEPQTIRSFEGIDIFWGEEANTITQESLDYLIPTLRKDTSEMWFTYNRKLVDEPVHNLKDRPNADFRQINYDQNPYFPQVLREEMEYDKAHDYEKYLHIWEGNPQQLSDAMVFKGKFRVECFETPLDTDIFYYGADWGFAKDPTTLIRCFIDGRKLFIDYEAYGLHTDIDDTPDLFDTVPGSRRRKIVADSARPETISYMNKNGFKVEAAKKGKDSIIDGIEFLKNYEIIIHERCKRTAYEFGSYQYKTDPLTGEVLPVLIDKDNHYIDACRYALEKVRRASRFMCS